MLSFVCFFFKKNQKKIDLKKASWPRFCNIIFLFLLKVGSVGPIDRQSNFVLTQIFPLKLVCDHFYITIIHKSTFFDWNITSSPYLEMILINMIKLLFLFFLINFKVRCCFLYNHTLIVLVYSYSCIQILYFYILIVFSL